MGAANPNASFWRTMDAYGAKLHRDSDPLVARAKRHPAPAPRHAAATAPTPKRRVEVKTFHGFSSGVGKTTSHPGVRRFDI